MRFTDYFNHTTPTISGVHGQLCSAYEAVGGGNWTDDAGRGATWKTQVLSVAHVLRSEGYETIYLNSGSPYFNHFAEVASNLGFEESLFRNGIETQFADLTREFLAEYPRANCDEYLSDILMFRVLDQIMKRHAERPRLVVLSTTGTHFPYRCREGLSYGDGTHPVLNALKTLDQAFAEGTRFLSEEHGTGRRCSSSPATTPCSRRRSTSTWRAPATGRDTSRN
jgi:hypothetical protein